MKVLIIGGNRFVGLRLGMELDKDKNFDLTLINRTGQSPHLKRAAIYKGDRRNLALSGVDKEFDAVVDFANFNDIDTESSLTHFKKIGRYIHISTASVYDAGADRKEEDFDPKKFDLSSHEDRGNPYQDGKRRAEALFAQQSPFPVAYIRLPYILGPDDYTRRLEFHIERIEKNSTLFVPNPSALISMIHAEDACRFLRWSLDQKFTGPVNVASPDAIRMADLLKEIEIRVGNRPLLVQAPTPQNRSPYGPDHDSSLNCDLAAKLGFKARPLKQWLGDLIDGARGAGPPPKILH
jgi:nucleoside-diphosphate-sugar epimerase